MSKRSSKTLQRHLEKRTATSGMETLHCPSHLGGEKNIILTIKTNCLTLYIEHIN